MILKNAPLLRLRVSLLNGNASIQALGNLKYKEYQNNQGYPILKFLNKSIIIILIFILIKVGEYEMDKYDNVTSAKTLPFTQAKKRPLFNTKNAEQIPSANTYKLDIPFTKTTKHK